MPRMKPFLYFIAFFVIASVAAVPGTGTASTIMAVGDSITAGTGSSSGYGYLPYLADILGTGYSFVGPNPSLPNTYANAGYPGYTTGDFLKEGTYTTVVSPTGQSYELMGQLAYTYQPDIILLHIGTNDLLNNVTAGTAYDRVVDMLSWVYGTMKQEDYGFTTDVYLSQIIPYNNDSSANAEITLFNSLLQNSLQATLSSDSRFAPTTTSAPRLIVQLVDMNSIFYNEDGELNTAYFSDIIHPNDSGYNAMAQAYGAAMNPVPIPAPVFLLAGGLAGLVAVRRRANRPS